MCFLYPFRGMLSSSTPASLPTEPPLFQKMCILQEADGLMGAPPAPPSSSSTGTSFASWSFRFPSFPLTSCPCPSQVCDRTWLIWAHPACTDPPGTTAHERGRGLSLQTGWVLVHRCSATCQEHFQVGLLLDTIFLLRKRCHYLGGGRGTWVMLLQSRDQILFP